MAFYSKAALFSVKVDVCDVIEYTIAFDIYCGS